MCLRAPGDMSQVVYRLVVLNALSGSIAFAPGADRLPDVHHLRRARRARRSPRGAGNGLAPVDFAHADQLIVETHALAFPHARLLGVAGSLAGLLTPFLVLMALSRRWKRPRSRRQHETL